MRVAGISQHQIAAADQHRNVRNANLEMVEHRLDVGIALHIEIRMRMPIAREELAQTQRVAGMARSDQHGVAYGVGDQVHAAQHERAQENLAEPGIRLHNAPQIRPADFQQRARFARPASHQAAPARELRHFAGEHPAAKHGDDSFPSARNSDEFDAAFQNDEDAVMRVSPLEKDFARPRLPLLAECRNPRHLRVIQLGEHLVE